MDETYMSVRRWTRRKRTSAQRPPYAKIDEGSERAAIASDTPRCTQEDGYRTSELEEASSRGPYTCVDHSSPPQPRLRSRVWLPLGMLARPRRRRSTALRTNDRTRASPACYGKSTASHVCRTRRQRETRSRASVPAHRAIRSSPCHQSLWRRTVVGPHLHCAVAYAALAPCRTPPHRTAQHSCSAAQPGCVRNCCRPRHGGRTPHC
mmetsp:Transcript_41281/g.88088  ORF Transcript_41281/g.88088 Transcript_41281/m.88088 type:complete len:207 (+) Transcript_41281:897-1517(+)